MRFSLITAAAVAGYASLAAAQSCNPSFKAAADPKCIADCNKKAGQEQYADWTADPSSPNFVKSLSYQCTRGTPAYTTFMTTSGACMMACSKEDQAAFRTSYAEVCAWYTEHSKDTCDGSSSSGGSSEPSASASGDAGDKSSSSAADNAKPSNDESLGLKLEMGSALVAAAVAGSAALLI